MILLYFDIITWQLHRTQAQNIRKVFDAPNLLDSNIFLISERLTIWFQL